MFWFRLVLDLGDSTSDDGRALARLGFKNLRVDQPLGDGKRITRRGYRLDCKLLERLNLQYGLAELKDPELASFPSFASSTMRGILLPTPEREKTDTHTTNDADDADDASKREAAQ